MVKTQDSVSSVLAKSFLGLGIEGIERGKKPR